jgi:hypothetical protein
LIVQLDGERERGSLIVWMMAPDPAR